MIEIPTRYQSALDLCMARHNKREGVVKCEAVETDFSDHKAILLHLGRGSSKNETKRIRKLNISSDLIQDAYENQLTWDTSDTVETLALKITNWTKHYLSMASSDKVVKIQAFRKH